MAKTPSTMLALGTPAPNFRLPDTRNGRTVAREDFAGKPLLVMFLSNHCPFVKHVRERLATLGKQLQDQGMGVVGISANDVSTHPEDSPEKMKGEAELAGYTFPYLYDETQSVAKSYQAACTPDFFLFDQHHRLVYRGQLDDSRPGNGVPVTGKDLENAATLLLQGSAPPAAQKPSLGCNIKWRAGNEPSYYSH